MHVLRSSRNIYNCSAVFRDVVTSYPRVLVHLLDELDDFKGWRSSPPSSPTSPSSPSSPQSSGFSFFLLPTLRSECEGWKVLVVLFCFFPSNAAEFIGGISLLHGDVDTLIRFSLYPFVF